MSFKGDLSINKDNRKKFSTKKNVSEKRMSECLICWEDGDLVELPDCNHLFCTSCLRKCIECNTRAEMECPNCTEIISKEFITDTFDDLSVSRAQEIQEIHCPHCDEATQDESNVITCSGCETIFCRFCEGKDCDEDKCEVVQQFKDVCADYVQQCPQCR